MAAGGLMTPDEPGAFHVETVELDGHAELRLVGELDMDTASRLEAALAPVYEQGVATLVLDLSELEFIDYWAQSARHGAQAPARARWPGRAPRADRPDAPGPW